MVKRAASEHRGSKRTKNDHPIASVLGKYANPGEIRTALASLDAGALTQALTTLRNQLTIFTNDDAISPQDERLILVTNWLDASPGAREIFSIMDRTPQPSPTVTSLCLAVLSSILNLVSIHFIYHPLGESIIKILLSPLRMRRLNLNLASASSELILSTLKVFNAMSTYAGNKHQRSLMDGFSWGQKSLHKLLFLRSKGKDSQEVNSMSKLDIRTLYVFFILSFLSSSTPTPIKLSLLEQHRDVFLLIFKGISQDPYAVARRILEVCWESVWNDPKIKRTLKIGLFSEQTINHLLKLYARDSPEDDTPDHIPADLVHHFMLALTTRPGVGICFRDHGWYPREHALGDGVPKNVTVDGDGDEFSTQQGGSINNKILANVVKGLKVNEDARQQELALKILEACPELVAGYWGGVNLTLEPRLSSRWITNMAVFGTIISLPIPTYSFLLPHSTQHNPSPPPLSSTLANVLPSVLTKSHLTKGLQSPSRLVQHCTALALSKCLTKLHRVLGAYRHAARQLEEEEETGQWSKRWRELEAEVERRVPDSMVIIAMVQQKYQGKSDEQGNAETTLLTESALRLLWMYHRTFPRLITEVRFDVGKLLLSVVDQAPNTPSQHDGMDIDDRPSIPRGQSQSRLDVLRQLHVLRLLRESEQFSWSSKSGISSHSYIHAILTLYTKTPHPAVRSATSDLLSHLLSSSILFSHDPAELILWLDALPLTRRVARATAPDGTTLSDEIASVLNFLDDCIQRCTKTPYRYVEEGVSFFSEASSRSSTTEDTPLTHDDPSNAPSPLLMTLLEQLRAKITATLMSPSDTLSVVTFIRKLIYSMTRKQPDLWPAWKLQAKLEEICSLQDIAPNAPLIQDAIKRECALLSNVLGFVEEPIIQTPVTSSPAVQQFVEQVENLPTPSSVDAGFIAAYELVDWMRLIHPELHPNDTKKLVLSVLRFSPTAIKEFLDQLDPRQGHLWPSIENHLKELQPQLPFELAYLHATPAQIAQSPIKDFLVSLFFSKTGWSQSFEHKLAIVMQRLASRIKRNERLAPHPEISLLTSILIQSHSRCTKDDMQILKTMIFGESKGFRELCCSRKILDSDLEEISALVKIGLDPESASDKVLAHEYCTYWITHSKTVSNMRLCALASPWINFMESVHVIQYLDVVISAVQRGDQLSETDGNALICILETLTRFQRRPELLDDLQCRSRGLLDLRTYLAQNSALDLLLLFVVEAGLPFGYNALPPSMATSSTISDVSLAAQERWRNRASRITPYSDITSEFLRFEDWTETTTRIVSGTLYQSMAARHSFSAWLIQREPHGSPSLEIIVIALHAYLDVVSIQGEGSATNLPDTWFLALVRRLLRGRDSFGVLSLCARCIRLVLEPSSQRVHYSNHLLNEVRSAASSMINIPFLLLIRDLHLTDAANFSALFEEIRDEALKWMAGRCSEGLQIDDDLPLIEELVTVVSRNEAKAHLVEPVVKAAIQNCFHVPRVIHSIIPLVSSTALKPALVNRVLQSIVQHSQLYRFTDASLPTRVPIVKLLHTLFHLHPTNTCQPSHIIPLTRLYGGTLSFSDRLLFSIFYLYEKQRKESVASIFRNWSASNSGSPSQDALDAIVSLDPTQVFRTCTAFPTRRSLDANVITEADHTGGDKKYDPAFLTLLVVQLLSEHRELSTTDWVQMFRSNAVSAVMCVLTSRDDAFRKVGVSTLAGVYQRVQNADFLERDQVIYIMDMLRDLLPPSSVPSASTPRLPIYPIMLIAHALRSIFYPSLFLYPIISRFLLQRPELDITDVPMLYSLLYSSEDEGDWLRERTWMIRFLTDSVREGGARDWAMLKRRHTWDIVASMWQAARKDERSLRRGVLEFIANLSANPHAITSLILRSSLLLWIELQLQSQSVHETENIAFVKILENILVTANGDKVNKAMRGEFYSTMARCLRMVLRGITLSKSDSSLVLLNLISRVALRVSSQPSLDTAILFEILKYAIGVLRSSESFIVWKNAAQPNIFSIPALLPTPPHYAHGLFDLFSTRDDTEIWGDNVRLLWKVTMSLGEWQRDRECWDALTCRLIVIRTSNMYSADEGREVDIGEWARRQMLGHLLESEGTHHE